MEKNNWGLIGNGNIGAEVARQVNQPEVAKRLRLSLLPAFVVRSTGIMQPDGVTPHEIDAIANLDKVPEVTFITMPSTDDGEVAYDYISTILEKGGKVVTAEKGAMANYFSELKEKSDNFMNLGVAATVGGGTRMMYLAQEYCRDRDNVSQIHLVMNGTITAMMSSVGPLAGNGMSLGQAVLEASTLGYAEPGSEDFKEVVRAEVKGDVAKKIAIFHNYVGLGDDVIDWNNLDLNLTDEDIVAAFEQAKNRRYVVSFYPQKPKDHGYGGPEGDIIGKFEYDTPDWKIVAGFRDTSRNPLLQPLASLTGPGNGMVVGLGPDEKDGIYLSAGPGAGPAPTVNTMLDDHIRLKRLEKS